MRSATSLPRVPSTSTRSCSAVHSESVLLTRTPESSSVTTAAVSSSCRTDRNAACTRTGRAPMSQRSTSLWCESWSSIAPPPVRRSLFQAGSARGGTVKAVATDTSSPASSLSIRSFKRRYTGWKRRLNPLIPMRSLPAAASSTRRASGASDASGFSTYACRPRPKASSAASACRFVGRHTIAASTPSSASASRQSPTATTPGKRAVASARASSAGSATATRRAPTSRAIAGRWR